MKKLWVAPLHNRLRITCSVATIIGFACLLPGQFACAEEVRALWVIRTSLGSVTKIQALVEEAYESGFNTLLVQVRGRGDALYVSDREPRAELLAGSPPFDPLSTVIIEARARGMKTHAWVNTHIVWGPVTRPLSPQHLVNANPDWLAVPRDLGRELHERDPSSPYYLQRLTEFAANTPSVEGLFTSPSHPAVQERVVAIWMDLASNYDLDGIHFDYIRYPSPQFDYSRGALNRFRGWVRPRVSSRRYAELDAASWDDPYAIADGLPDLWNRFRRDQISVLVRRVYRAVKQIRPDLVVSAAVLPDHNYASKYRFQAWWTWLADGFLDVAVPMAYTDNRKRFSVLVEDASMSIGTAKRVWIGVGAYKNSVKDTLWQIRHARSQGFGGVALFSYEFLSSDRPDREVSTTLKSIGIAAFGDS